MEALVDQAMREGAIGLSSGLMYTPNRYASTEELIALAKIASRYGGLYITHIRNEGDGLVDGLAEAVRIGREAGIPVEVLHFKRVGIRLIGGSERPNEPGRGGLYREIAARGGPHLCRCVPIRGKSDDPERCPPRVGAGRGPRADAGATT